MKSSKSVVIHLPEQKAHLGYTLLTCKTVSGKTCHFLVDPQNVKVGGEAIIYFGYQADDRGNSLNYQKVAIRKLKLPTVTPEQVDLEIKATQILYKNTSERFIFEEEGLFGFAMQILPGKDFMKKREHHYTRLLVHKSGDISERKLEDNQLVLSENTISWLEDGKIESYDLNKIRHKILYKTLEKIFNESADLSIFDLSILMDPKLIDTLKLETLCTPANGLDGSEFEKLNLSFLQRCQILKDIFKQLSQFHTADAFHGDVNPANIKIHVDKNNNALAFLFDFGQSRFLDGKRYLNDHFLSMMQDFIPPETVGKDAQFSCQSDMFSAAGIMGMILSRHPNDFIRTRLTKSRDLEKSRAQFTEITETLANQPYDTDALFKDVTFYADQDSIEELKKLMTSMTEPFPFDRPSSLEVFNVFDRIVKKELRASIVTTQNQSAYEYEEVKNVTKEKLGEIKKACIYQMHHANNLSSLFIALKQWANAASVYQKTKESKPYRRFLNKGVSNKDTGEIFKKVITNFVDEIINNEGDMSKKTKKGNRTLEQKFNWIKEHAPNGTIIKQLTEILAVYNKKSNELLNPTPQKSLGLG